MKLRKVLSLAMVCSMIAGTAMFSQPAQAEDLEGVNAFIFKASGIRFGELLYDGFVQYMDEMGEPTVFKAGAETTVSAQVELLDELITQNVKSITIACCGETGYDQVFKKAQEKGITIVSVDAKASPDYRIVHTGQASTETIGRQQVQMGVLISLGIDYPEDGDMRAAVEKALADYDGEPLTLGVLSGAVDSPVQNGWIAYMEEELADDIYQGKVNPLDIKYGNDDMPESTIQANAFLAEGKVNVIIAPTTVGIMAAGQVLSSSGSDVKVTGIGIPSEMASFMPAKPEDNAFDFVCPYMEMWDLYHFGATAAAATYAALYDGFTGEAGESFTMHAYGDYDEAVYEAYEIDDGGTEVLQGEPLVFTKDNMATWVELM